MDRRAQHRQRGQGRDTSIPASAIAQWAKNNPLDAAALATSPIPILGDVVGGAADLKGLLDNPSFANAGLLAAGMLPFVPAGTLARSSDTLLNTTGKYFRGSSTNEIIPSDDGMMGPGVYVASVPYEAERYVDRGEGAWPNIAPLQVDGKVAPRREWNLVVDEIFERDKIVGRDLLVAAQKEMKKRGYIGVERGPDATVIFDKADVRSQFVPAGTVKRVGEGLLDVTKKADALPTDEASRMARPGAIFEDFSRFSGYNTPSKPERDFADDYPEFKGQAGEKLNQSIDGDALRAKFIVGRQNAGQRDVGLDAKDARQTAESLVDYVGPGRGAELPRGAVGAYRRERVGDDISREILIDENLSSDGIVRVARHELGHAIDEIAGDISTTGIRKELDQIYHDLNDAPHRVGKTSNRTSPKNFRYKAGPDTEKELIAESLRAYMEDPNYLKTVAPKTAKRIRESINNNPRIKNIIQFNTIGGLGLTGLLGSRLMGEDEEQY
jgi:hypothetical protein